MCQYLQTEKNNYDAYLFVDTLPMTTPESINPTSNPSSKWNNLYILPVILGAAIIVVVVLISYKLRNTSSRDDDHVRHSTRDREKAMDVVSDKQAVAPFQQSKMSNSTPFVPFTTTQLPPENNYKSLHRSKGHGNVSNISRGARGREPAMQNYSKTRHGQMSRNGHMITKRNKVLKQKPTNTSRAYYSNKTPCRQIQRTSAGYPACTGIPACRAYPGYLNYASFNSYNGYSTSAHPQIPSMANRGYMGKQWY